MAITIYSKNNCMQCKMTKKFLTAHNLDYVEHNVSEEPEFLDQLRERGLSSLPVVDSDNYQTFTGFAPDKLHALVDNTMNANA